MNERKPARNRAASIRQRLLDRARVQKEDFQFLLDRYAVERMLYRLSILEDREQFLLKGALLFTFWFDEPHRPTRDADFLSFGAPDAERLVETVRRLCVMECDDGITYDAGSLRVQEIRENARYQGLRVTLSGDLDNARCNVQLDVGYGDVVTPAPVELTYPTLLDEFPAARLRAYPRETVFAEKLEAIAQFGIANSRMKDYFDLLALAREGAMDLPDLSRAIAATFSRRQTPLPNPLPIGLTQAFARDLQKQKQWNAFVARNRLDAPALDAVIDELAKFVSAV
ncbi:MAG: nucleotidyl transferase AbiEii/AbiGii toxin family protein [Betaproteobacteria bacterium]